MDTFATVRFRVYGIVQGVGFRPTVDRHASASGIRGSVCNKGPYVEIVAQGEQGQIEAFERLLRDQPPRRSSILRIDKKELEEAPAYDAFSIIESEKTRGEIFISPDIAICEDCIREMYDPADKRYLHPFINCTCCGPRLTILDALPYDRERTSMKMFPMCRSCAEEYYSPLSRRYDAQPVCCNDCGPEVYLLDTSDPEAVRVHLEDKALPVDGHRVPLDLTRGRDAITAARRAVLEGGIVAVKGIGGFHLCCDATNEAAVERLRARKHRPAKPFAVMMRDVETVRRECLFNEEQEQILTGHQKPILLLDRRDHCPGPLLAPSVAPGNPKVGVMLPYAPLQLLLFDYNDGLEMPDCLVMTSGNVSGAPICRDDADALKELSGFCDCILSHNRLIRIRADDTVMDFHRGHPYMIRRSRGYAPLPVLYSGAGSGRETELEGCVLAIGGELKNTFCIASGNLFYLSPYVGDLEDLRTVAALRETAGRMEKLLEVTPRAVVCDLHPKYNATMVAEEIADQRGIPLIRIQHHYAHILSCMAENDRTGPVIGVSFDGTGFGEDGTIWGGEILIADAEGFRRAASIAPFTQIGGDSAPRQGWRIAASMILDLCRGQDGQALTGRPYPDSYFGLLEALDICDLQNARAQRMMAERGIQTVTSTSAGRLFDAVSAMLGIRRESSYEGEASIELEFAAGRYLKKMDLSMASADCIPGQEPDGQTADQESAGPAARRDSDLQSLYEEVLAAEAEEGPDKDFYRLPTDRLFAALLKRRLAGEDPEKLAFCFHAALAELIIRACRRISGDTGIRTAALSGGCFQNRLLLTLVQEGLEREGLEVLIHHLVPPNDGGIALGQALAAMWRLRKEAGTETGRDRQR